MYVIVEGKLYEQSTFSVYYRMFLRQYLASDEIAYSAYGANLDKTYRFKSIHNDLEPFLLERTNNSPDNLTKYLVEWKGNKYAVVKVTPLYIDIQWR